MFYSFTSASFMLLALLNKLRANFEHFFRLFEAYMPKYNNNWNKLRNIWSKLEEQNNQYQCQPPMTSEAVIENLLLFDDSVLFFGSPFFFLSQLSWSSIYLYFSIISYLSALCLAFSFSRMNAKLLFCFSISLFLFSKSPYFRFHSSIYLWISFLWAMMSCSFSRFSFSIYSLRFLSWLKFFYILASFPLIYSFLSFRTFTYYFSFLLVSSNYSCLAFEDIFISSIWFEYRLSTEFFFIWLIFSSFSLCFLIWFSAFCNLFSVYSKSFLFWSRCTSTFEILSVTRASSICNLKIVSLFPS